jgi:hypothetical protein
MLLPVLSPETFRRFEDTEEVRLMPWVGDEKSDSRVLRRDEGGSGTDLGVRPELER